MSYARRKIPIPELRLRALLLHLEDEMKFEIRKDGVVSTSCDHSLRRTEAFLRGLGGWSNEVRDWLGEHGGFCDCEVLLNVGGRWEEEALKNDDLTSH
jgi:hypothetical protein